MTDLTRTPIDELCAVVLRKLDGDLCFGSATMTAKTGLHGDWLRGVMAELRRRGHAEFHRGLLDESGDVAGAGHCATLAGMDWVREYDRD